MTSDNHHVYLDRWNRDLPEHRPTTDNAAHHDQVRNELQAGHRLPWDTALAPAHTRTEAQRYTALTTIRHAQDSLQRATIRLITGGALRDGADPTQTAAVLYATARAMAQSPQWADVVRPPMGRHAPGFRHTMTAPRKAA